MKIIIGLHHIVMPDYDMFVIYTVESDKNNLFKCLYSSYKLQYTETLSYYNITINNMSGVMSGSFTIVLSNADLLYILG